MENGFIEIDEWIDDVRKKYPYSEEQKLLAYWYFSLRARQGRTNLKEIIYSG